MSEPKVILRDAPSWEQTPIPEQFQFLLPPIDRRRFSFLHPSYPGHQLFSLNGYDDAEGGVHYGLAHTACAIIANNHFDGFLARDREGNDRVQLDWQACLPYRDEGYFFHVPHPGTCHLPRSPIKFTDVVIYIDNSEGSAEPYRWPFVPSFLDWKYPHNNLPGPWHDLATQAQYVLQPHQSDLTMGVHLRDTVCKVSGFTTSTDVAHLVPLSERTWFKANNMPKYNSNQLLSTTNLMRDISNAVLLRKDIHKAFDDRMMMFFPKDSKGFAVHVLEPAPDLCLLYHNSRINFKGGVQFLFVRFAWCIFPLLASFMDYFPETRLAVKWDSGKGTWNEREADAKSLQQSSACGRSNIPAKRAKMTTPATPNDGNEWLDESHDIESSSRSPTKSPFSAHDSNSEDRSTKRKHDQMEFDSIEDDDEAESVRHDRLRRLGLREQRPKGYCMPPYDPDRGAREELELMGVEILGDDV